MHANDDALVMRSIHLRGDRSILGMLLFHAVAAVCFGAFYDTWVATFVISGAAIGMFLLAWSLQPGSSLTRSIAGISLQAFVALHIYQLHGLAEMHFFFFTAFAAMLVYQDWLCMWPGALLIIAQHVVFAILHNSGTISFFFEDDYISVTKLGFHFGIALLHVGLCNLWAIQLRAQTLRDARSRRDLEAAQRAAEQSSAAKTVFLGDMSHELRTPMSGVLGMTELLLQQPLPSEVRESLEIVHNSALAMVDIVNDGLDLARIEAGKLEVTEEPMDLRQLCEEVADLLGPRAQQAGVELVVRWQPGSPQRLRGDAGRWRQVLTNLAGNAIKFARGGHVLIDAAVRPAPVGARTQLVLRIDDSGAGIPPDVLRRLFQRFEQGGAKTFGKHGGSGLGLAISRELVNLMHGQLTAHSVVGAGSTFVVAADVTVVEPAVAPPPCPHRVLLVGQHDLTLGVIAEQLESMGADVRVVHDAAAGRRALAAAAAAGGPIQLLLTEPSMLAHLDEASPDLRVIALGPADDGRFERIVWLHRHQELERLVAGAPRSGEFVRTAQPRLGLRVLLAEDDAVCVKVAQRMLALLGCEAVHAPNGVVAVERCRRERFDVVLMDCRMPELGGIEATRRIRAAEVEGRQRIVMLSANSLPADRQLCFAAGADAFLGKPVRLDELRELLVRVHADKAAAAAGAGA